MRWSMRQLENLVGKTLEINEEVQLDDLVKVRNDISSISPIVVKGNAKFSQHLITFDLNIECELGISCALTLEKVLYPIKIDTVEKYVFEESFIEEDEILITSEGINLAPIIWQNIIVNIPTKVVSKNAQHMQKSGENWVLQTEDEYYTEKENEIDPRLAVLQNFFKNEQ